MTVVVVGASGWLGQAILPVLPGAVPVLRSQDLSEVLAAVGPAPIVVNAAGVRAGPAAPMWRGNVDLVAALLEACGWLIQLGSAAEVGLGAASPITESTACEPTTDYGRAKYEATRMALASDRAAVLRVFNVVDSPPQAGSPLADILSRVRRGVETRTPIEVLCGGTARDYVTRGFVAESVRAAVDLRPAGLFNVGGGLPVTVADIATSAVSVLGSRVAVTDLREFPATRIWSDPRAWQEVSGLRQTLDAAAVAKHLTGRLS